MLPTVKLYYEDAYMKEFEAEVLSCTPVKDFYEIILDRTAFFPEEGGQTPDLGTLNGEDLLDVQIKDNVIIHKVAKALTLGEKVKGAIDWEHRFNNMQQHSGEHIFSGIACSTFGCDNVGFHLSGRIVTLDLNKPLTSENIKFIEDEANKVIVSNLPILAEFPPEDVLKDMYYRSKIELFEDIRIVTIPGVDVCACCAPHVAMTGEIGLLKVQSVQNYKGGVRVSILCGFRALKDYESKMNAVNDISVTLSSKPEEVAEKVKKLHDENGKLRFELNSLRKELMLSKLSTIQEGNGTFVFEDGLDNNAMREGVNYLTSKCKGFCGIFSGNDSDGYKFIIGASDCDAREAVAAMKKSLEVRGGGSKEMVQGSVKGAEKAIRDALA